MPTSESQQFLRDLDKKLWSAADRLRATPDAAVYKHAVLGLIFLKYVWHEEATGGTHHCYQLPMAFRCYQAGAFLLTSR